MKSKNIFVFIAAMSLVSTTEADPVQRIPRSAKICGRAKTNAGLIVGGQNFKRGDFPWIVALLYQSSTENPSYFCGGTIISPIFVISAAHCILDKGSEKEVLARNIRVFFGAHRLDDYLESGRFTLSPTRIILHEEWNHRTTQYDADLCLLQFEEDRIHFSDFVQPICLWDSEKELSRTEGLAVGWGSTDTARTYENVPKLTEIPIITNEECLPGQREIAEHSSTRTFCAGLNGSSVCFGDSGSGLFTKQDGLFYLIGIVSSSPTKNGNTVCDVSKNAVYTNVLKFKDWIRYTILEGKLPNQQNELLPRTIEMTHQKVQLKRTTKKYHQKKLPKKTPKKNHHSEVPKRIIKTNHQREPPHKTNHKKEPTNRVHKTAKGHAKPNHTTILDCNVKPKRNKHH